MSLLHFPCWSHFEACSVTNKFPESNLLRSSTVWFTKTFDFWYFIKAFDNSFASFEYWRIQLPLRVFLKTETQDGMCAKGNILRCSLKLFACCNAVSWNIFRNSWHFQHKIPMKWNESHTWHRKYFSYKGNFKNQSTQARQLTFLLVSDIPELMWG